MSEAVKIAELRSRLNEAMGDVEVLNDPSAQSQLKQAYEKCKEHILSALDAANNSIKNTLARFITWLQSKLGHVNEAQINESIKAMVSKFFSIAKFLRDLMVYVLDIIAGVLIAIGITVFTAVLITKITGILGISALALGAYHFLGSAITALTGIPMGTLGLAGIGLAWAVFSGWGTTWRKYGKDLFKS